MSLWGAQFLVLLIGGVEYCETRACALALRRKERATRIALGAGRAAAHAPVAAENWDWRSLRLCGYCLSVPLFADAELNRPSNIFPRAGEVHRDAPSLACLSRFPSPLDFWSGSFHSPHFE